jgi:ATP-binding cassette subfamily F protein uup
MSPDKRVRDVLAEGGDWIDVRGVRKHIQGYLKDFLFEPGLVDAKVGTLSGGERSRLLLAREFARKSNLLVLDEPTNDLDMETLDLLEERLMEFNGTVLTVSHDREFLNQVVTSTIVFEDDGVREYVGGYDDWIRQRAEATETAKPAAVESRPTTAPVKVRRLSFKEQRELETLPATIEQLEAEIAQLHAEMANPQFYQQPGDRIAKGQALLADKEAKLAYAYTRWEELEAS